MADRPDPTRVVADADVLAADLLVGDAARDALDLIRSHSWMTLVASESLIDDAEAVIATLATPDVAGDWREKIESFATIVTHPSGDHPALAATLHGRAARVLTFDESLTSARAGVTIRQHVATSLTSPDAFVATFNPESLYASAREGDYPGPDRNPRA